MSPLPRTSTRSVPFRRLLCGLSTLGLVLLASLTAARAQDEPHPPRLSPPAEKKQRIPTQRPKPIAFDTRARPAAATIPGEPAATSGKVRTAGTPGFDNRPIPAEAPSQGYWIVSSRDVKGTPAKDDCIRQLDFLYRTPSGMTTASPESFFAELRSDRPVCIVIHGSYNYWNDVLRESERNHAWIQQAAAGREVQFVYFTWPSDGYAHVVFPVELRMMGRRAAVHGGYLAQLVSEFPANQPVTIMGHSHGARCAVAALHALGGGALDDGSHLPAGSSAPRRVRGVLIAAAVDHDWLNPGNRYGLALEPVESLLVIHNHRDGWLSVYPLHSPFKGQQALGRKGFDAKDRERLEGFEHKIRLYDSSAIAGRSHDFSTINSSPEIAAAITPYVTFQRAERHSPPRDRR